MTDLKPETKRMLLLVKQMNEHGREHSNIAGSFNKIVAIHQFDNSVEILLKTIAQKYDISYRDDPKIYDLFERISREFNGKKKKLPYKHQIKKLVHEGRNRAQHQGIAPSSSAIEDARSFTQRFMERGFKVFFGVKYEEVSEAELIEDSKIKEELIRARQFLEENNLLEGERKAYQGLKMFVEKIVHYFIPTIIPLFEGLASSFTFTASVLVQIH